jgi:gliding motility-associated-like protein
VCAGNPVVLSAAGANTYSWTSGALPTIGQNYTLTPISTNNYSVSGTNTLTGCSSTYTSSISALPLPTVTVGNYSLCLGDSLNVVPSGAAVYTFLSGSALSTPSVSGTFSIIGTSSLGCVSSNTAVSAITVYSLPIISISNGGICSGQTFTIAPTGAVSYTFVNGGPVVSPSVTTSYSVYGASNQGCVSQPTAVATVSIFPNPTITVASGSICSGEIFTIQPSGALTYTISGGTSTVSPLANTVYSISGTNSLGCNSVQDGTCQVTVDLTPTITVSNGTICAGQSFTFTHTGAVTYTYSGGSAVVSPSVTSVYQISGFSASGCVSSPYLATITVNQLPQLNAVFIPSVPCQGDSITPIASGASTLIWSGGLVNGTTVDLPITPQQFTITGIDINGCINSTVTTLVSRALPQIKVSSSNSVSCETALVILTASGASSYTWQNSISGNTVSFSPLTTSNYSLIGTDEFGCRNSASFTQSVIPCSQNFTAYATVTDVECFKKNNGKIQAFANADYDQKTISYKWSNGFCPEDTCTIANNLPAGIYKLKVLLTYTLNNILVKKDSLLLGPFSVADEKGPCNITIFNGISISSGNDNDHFYIKNIEMYPQNKVTVFNRWGQLIKEINGYNNKDVVWPGTAEIENLQPSTYFYIIDLADGSTPIKGWIEVTKR